MGKNNFIQPQETVALLTARHPLFRAEAHLSPYVRCTGACVYCPYGGEWRISVKTNIVYQFEKTLAALGEKKLLFGLGASCEPYCDREKEFGITRALLQLALEYAMPVQLFTRSPLALRDRALLRKLSQKGLLAVSVPVFTLDEKTSAAFEPGSPSPAARLSLLRELRRSGVLAGALLAPVVPFVSDGERELDTVLRGVKKAGAEYLLPSVLVMENRTVRRNVLAAVKKLSPAAETRLRELYGNNALPPQYYTVVVDVILRRLARKHALDLTLPAGEERGIPPGMRQKLLK